MDAFQLDDYREFAEMIERILEQGEPFRPFAQALGVEPAPRERESEWAALAAASRHGLVRPN